MRLSFASSTSGEICWFLRSAAELDIVQGPLAVTYHAPKSESEETAAIGGGDGSRLIEVVRRPMNRGRKQFFARLLRKKLGSLLALSPLPKRKGLCSVDQVRLGENSFSQEPR
nr:hypothetical protein CFP56_26017 [Quercus suber]